jgi:signal transduction histidine kinase
MNIEQRRHSLALLVFAFCLHAFVYGGFFGFVFTMDGFGNYSLWFPAAGFRFALIFILGWRWGLLIAMAEITAQGVLGDWATWDYRPLWIFFGSGSPAFVHAFVIFLLVRFRLTSPDLRNLSEVSWFVGALVITPLIAAPVAAGLKVLGGRVALEELPMSIMSYWIGDMVGMLMFAPLIILAWQAWQHSSWPRISDLIASRFAMGYAASVLLIWLTVQYAGGGPLTLRWLPFVIPVLFMAIQYGFAGAAPTVFTLNLMVWNLGGELTAIQLFEHQGLLAFISVLGLLVGGLVTARQRDSDQLRSQYRTMAHMDRRNTMGEMATHIIHELAQPINATSIYAGSAVAMLEAGTLDRDTLLEAMNQTAYETDRLGELINRMQRFATDGELRREETTAEEVIDGISHMIDLAANKSGTTVSVDLPVSPMTLHVDMLQIQQAILNLTRNAMEAMEGMEIREVTIAAAHNGNGQPCITVTDTGPGISKRPPSGESSKPGGMGVGLQVVDAIMAAHDGQLILDGNECRLVLPRTAAPVLK